MDSFRNFLNEDFFHRVIQGKAETIKTLGIITAENPGGKKYVKTTNEKKNEDLATHLRRLGYEPIEVSGKFMGQNEHPFLLFNITRDQLITLGKKFKQAFVIYGQKQKGKFHFSYIANGHTIRAGKKLRLDQDDENNYIRLGSEKYVIK